MVEEQYKDLYMLRWHKHRANPAITREQLDVKIAGGLLTGLENVSEITNFDDLFSGDNPYNKGKLAPMLYWNMLSATEDLRRTFKGCSGIQGVKLNLPQATNLLETFAYCPNLSDVELTLPTDAFLANNSRTVNTFHLFTLSRITKKILIKNMSKEMNVALMFFRTNLRGAEVKLYGLHNSNSHLFTEAYLDSAPLLYGVPDITSNRINPYGMFLGATLKDNMVLMLPMIYGDYIQSGVFSETKMKDCIVTIDTSNVASFSAVCSDAAEGFEPKALYITVNVDIVDNFYQVYSNNPRLDFDLEIEIPTDRGFNASGFLKNCTAFKGSVTFKGGKEGGSDPWRDGINLYEGLMGCHSFNNKLNINLNAAVSVSYLFADCIRFDQVVYASSMTYPTSLNGFLQGCAVFNQSVTLLTLVNLTSVVSMMEGCKIFNNEITLGLNGTAVNASKMFKGCDRYNRGIPIGMTHINNGESMFEGCFMLNHPLTLDVTKASNLKNMFKGAIAFIQDISHWNVEHIPEKPVGFDDNTNPLWTDEMKPQWGKAPIVG